MIKSRNHDIVIKSQFNINGSRGKDAGKFVRDYISRDSATDRSMAYRFKSTQVPEVGDGVAFTLDSTGITRQRLLNIADHVQTLNEKGRFAIQQMVISFAPDYLIREGLVDPELEVVKKGDYRGQYDDVRLRHAVRSGLQSLVDMEGYDDGRAVSCIQWDTRHLHVHTVIYENGKIKRWHNGEEKGVLRESSLNQLAFDIDRKLDITKTPSMILVPSQFNLMPEADVQKSSKPEQTDALESQIEANEDYIDTYLELINAKKREKLIKQANNVNINDVLQTNTINGLDALDNAKKDTTQL